MTANDPLKPRKSFEPLELLGLSPTLHSSNYNILDNREAKSGVGQR